LKNDAKIFVCKNELNNFVEKNDETDATVAQRCEAIDLFVQNLVKCWSIYYFFQRRV